MVPVLKERESYVANHKSLEKYDINPVCFLPNNISQISDAANLRL